MPDPTLEERYLMTLTALVALCRRCKDSKVYVTNLDLAEASTFELQTASYGEGIVIEAIPTAEQSRIITP